MNSWALQPGNFEVIQDNLPMLIKGVQAFRLVNNVSPYKQSLQAFVKAGP
jgi:hypothetical protein